MSILPSPIPTSNSILYINAVSVLNKHRTSCNKDVLELNNMEVAMILSLAHMTGWSAELIASKLDELLNTDILPELVWRMYKEWRDARDENRLDGSMLVENIKTNRAMAAILEYHGIEPNYFAIALSQTPCPISARFSGLWYPKKYGCALLEEFTETTRQECVRTLCWRPKGEDLAKPTHDEAAVLEKLGKHVIAIVKELLECWIVEMAEMQKEKPFTRAIEVCPVNIKLIVRYGERFGHEWENVFGKMKATGLSWLPLPPGTQIYRNLSTGHVSKTFFTMMLYTRLETMQERRRIWREIVGFRYTPLRELPEDVQDCHICQQPLGVPDEDGLVEMPIQVIACCGNYFGSKCLDRWYGEFENRKCPLCNCHASPEFLHRLFNALEERTDEVNEDSDEESFRARRSFASPMPENGDELEYRYTDMDPRIVEQYEAC